MKLIFGILVATIAISQPAQAQSYGCQIQSGKSAKISFTLMIDNQNEKQAYAVQSTTNGVGWNTKSYYFYVTGQLSKKKLDIIVPEKGIVGRWVDQTQEKDIWEAVDFGRTGYIKAKAGLMSRRMTGVASLPFIENGAQLKVSCAEAVEGPKGCLTCL